MNVQEHLLSCLAEECAEIAQEVSKALRFGLDNVYPEGSRTVRAKITSEFYDLVGVIDVLEDNGILQINAAAQSAARAAKRAKLMRFLEYAREQGALQ